MVKYRVEKQRGTLDFQLLWKVMRIRGLEKITVSRWPGQGLALEAALELAGLAKPETFGAPAMKVRSMTRWAAAGVPTPISGDATTLERTC